VILVLVAIAVPNYLNVIRRANLAKAKLQIGQYKAALAEYHTDTRQYPPSGSEHVYYILSGLAPFNQKVSKRYNPPYYEFSQTEIGKPGDGSDYQTLYQADTELQIERRQTPGNPGQKIPADEIFRDSPFNRVASSGEKIRFFPIIDPWGRPVIYISPDDLKAKHNGDTTLWNDFIALSDEQAYNDKGVNSYLPYDIQGGQFWAAGPDGITGSVSGNPGFFQPGNLVGDDGRDNDGDGLSDASDSKASETSPAEDDIHSW
jgi:type II secretory pathway pseudopilin PulG